MAYTVNLAQMSKLANMATVDKKATITERLKMINMTKVPKRPKWR